MHEMEDLLRDHTGRANLSGLYTTIVAKLQTYRKEVQENRPVTNPEAPGEWFESQMSFIFILYFIG